MVWDGEGYGKAGVMRVLVCGGRDFADEEVMSRALYAAVDDTGDKITGIIEGGAHGADRLARKWAERCAVPIITYPADWQTHGRAAGPIRNQRMLDEGKPDLVVAFPGGRGTADMVRRAKGAGVRVIEVRPYDAERHSGFHSGVS